MKETERKPGAEVLPEQNQQSREDPVEAAEKIASLTHQLDQDTVREIKSSLELLQKKGPSGEEIERAEEAGKKLEREIDHLTQEFLSEIVKSSPEHLRHTINEHASFLATLENPVPEDLAKEYSLDPETAQAYFKLAQTFGKSAEGPGKENVAASTGKETGASKSGQQISEALKAKIAELNEAERRGEPEEVLEAKLKEVRNLESEKAKEVPAIKKPEAILRKFNLDNRNFIQKLPENAWKFFKDKILKPPAFVLEAFVGKISHKALKSVESAHRKFGFVGSRIGILFNSALIDREKTGWLRYGTSLEGLQIKYDEQEAGIKEFESELGELDNQEKEMEEEGELTAGIKLKIENARAKIRTRIEQAGNKRDSLGNRLKETRDRIKIYESSREAMVKELLERIEPNLSPLLERSEKLEEKKETLDSEIADFSSLVNEKQAKLDEILQKMKKYPNLKSALKHRRDKMQKEIKGAKKIIAVRGAEARDADRELSRVNERANPWQEMRSQFTGITNPGLAEALKSLREAKNAISQLNKGGDEYERVEAQYKRAKAEYEAKYEAAIKSKEGNKS